MKASIKTSSGEFVVESGQELQIEKWYVAGLRFRNGGLELGVNGERVSTAVSGNIIYGAVNNNLILARNFYGLLDEFKIGQERDDNAVVRFGGGSLKRNIVFGQDGTASFSVESTGYTVPASIKVGFSAESSAGIADVETLDDGNSRIADNKFLARFFPAAHARPVPGSSDADSNGIAVVDQQSFGWALDTILKATLGELYDPIKTALAFLYELSGISDIVTIVKITVSVLGGKVLTRSRLSSLGSQR